MRRTASEIIRDLEIRIARLERSASSDPVEQLNAVLGNAKVQKVISKTNIPGGVELVVKLTLWKAVGIYEPIQKFRVLRDGQVLGWDDDYGWESYP